jgi:multidrug efflux pump subunit AcrA (membrane-fusion protein)
VKNAVVDPAARTVEVLADLVRVEGPPLRPGTLLSVDFGAFGEKGALFLPATALRSGPEGTWVLLAVGGRAERRDVTATPVNPGTVAIRSGLSASDPVVLDPGALAPGEAVVALGDEAAQRQERP